MVRIGTRIGTRLVRFWCQHKTKLNQFANYHQVKKHRIYAALQNFRTKNQLLLQVKLACFSSKKRLIYEKSRVFYRERFKPVEIDQFKPLEFEGFN